MKFINLTPHPVVLSNGALRITFEKQAGTPVVRVKEVIEERTVEHEIAPGVKITLPINNVKRVEVQNLPEPQEGVMYIVSSMVAQHVKRPDVIAPITDSTCERDELGRVVSVKGFQSFVPAEVKAVGIGLKETAATK